MDDRLLSVFAGLVMIVPALMFVAPPAEAATTQTLAITQTLAKPLVAFQGFDGNPPKVFDINGDGKLEIIAQNDNQYVYVFDSTTGAILFQAKTKFPTSWGARSFNGPEVAIMQNGAKPRLIVENSAAYVTAYEFDPTTSTSTRFTMTKLWERRLTECHSNPGSDSKPTLADLNNDGTLEILVNTEEVGVYALKQDGTLYWKQCIGGGNAEPSVGDLDQDGDLDVVHVSDGGVVSALNGRTGLWMWPAYNILAHYGLGSASIPVGAAIGQLDRVGGPDIVVGVRDSHDANVYTNNHALLLALDSNGKKLWGTRDVNGGNPLTYTHPMIVDTDQNGYAEVYWGDWNTMGHKPPWDPDDAFKRLGPANFYRFNQNGYKVWETSLDTYWSNKDLALADVDDDGVQEVLANGPGTGGDGIWYLNSKTGAKKDFVPLHPWQASRGPVVADLWATGTMQWIIEAGGADGTTAGPAILVYDTHVAYDSAWPHLPYTTMSKYARFAATFTPQQVGNDTWVEVQVTTSVSLATVEVQLNGSPYQALTKTPSGTWGKTVLAPDGTTVKFRATSTGGAYQWSKVFTWT